MPSKPLCHFHHCAERSCPQTHVCPGFPAFQSWTPALPALQYKAFMAQGRCHWFPTEIHSCPPPPPTHTLYITVSGIALPPHTHTHTAHNCVRGWYLCTYCFPLGCAPLQLFLIQSYLSEPLPPASPKKPSEAANPRAFLLSLATSEKLRSPAAFLVPTPGRAASLQGTWQRALPPFPCSFLSTAGSSPHSLALHPPRCLCTSLYPSPGSSLSFPIRETRKFGAGRSSIPLAPVPGLLTWSGRELGLLSQQPLYRAGSVCAWGRVATQALGRVRRVWRV